MQDPTARYRALAFALTSALTCACATEITDSADTATGGSGPAGGQGSVAGSSSGGNGNGAGGSGGPAAGGTAPNAGSPGAGGSAPANCTARDTGASVLRRLSSLEYQLTLQDLFLLPAPPSIEGIAPDTTQEGFKTFAEVQTVSPQHLRGYLEKASELASALLSDATRRPKVLGCEPSATGCLRSFLLKFGRLAFRRALEPSEVEAYAKAAEADALDQTDQFRFVIEALLTSPSFLYRVELGNQPEGLSTLTSGELASRLSFGVWGRAPNVELLDRAASGALDSDAALASTAATMLADARAHDFFGAFFRQWLGFETLRAPTKPTSGWSDGLMPLMQQETDTLLAEYAWQNKNFLDILTSNHSTMPSELSKFYGVAASGTSVTFPPGHVRENTGVLTHASLLGMKSDGDAIAIRGNWLRRTFLCKNLEVPPSVAEQLGELLVGLTRVQIVAKRNQEGACVGCHSVIDPIGVGFAAFDSSGKFDATLNPAEYGIAPALPDAPNPAFSSVGELAAKLRALPEVSACLSEKAFLYVYGHHPASEDACTVQSSTQAFVSSNNGLPALLQGLTSAPAFRLRRAPSVSP